VRRPARQHHPAGSRPPHTRPLELALRQLEDLVHPLVDDVRQQLARRLPRPWLGVDGRLIISAASTSG